MPAYNDTNIPLISDHDHNKFLGDLRNPQHVDNKAIEEAAEEYEKRMWIIFTIVLYLDNRWDN